MKQDSLTGQKPPGKIHQVEAAEAFEAVRTGRGARVGDLTLGTWSLQNQMQSWVLKGKEETGPVSGAYNRRSRAMPSL